MTQRELPHAQRVRPAATGLLLAGGSVLLLAVVVLSSAPTETLLAAALLGAIVLPTVAAAVAAVVSGLGLRRAPARSRVGAIASGASLAVCCGLLAYGWLHLSPGPLWWQRTRLQLLLETALLAGALVAALGSALRLALPGRRPGSVPGWATSASAVGTALVAVLVADLVQLTAPTLTVSGRTVALGPGRVDARGTSAEAEDPVCRELRALPDRSGGDLGVRPLPPALPGGRPYGATVLDALPTGLPGGLPVAVPVDAGLPRLARPGVRVVAVASRVDRRTAQALPEVLAGLGIELGGQGTVLDQLTDGYYATDPAHPDGGQLLERECVEGPVVLLAQSVDPLRSGPCLDLAARCRALADVARRGLDAVDGTVVVDVRDAHLRATATTTALGPALGLTDELRAGFADWRDTTPTPVCDLFCAPVGFDTPVTLTWQRPGYTARATVTPGVALTSDVVVEVREA